MRPSLQPLENIISRGKRPSHTRDNRWVDPLTFGERRGGTAPLNSGSPGMTI